MSRRLAYPITSLATFLFAFFLLASVALAIGPLARYGGNVRYPVPPSTGAGYGIRADIWTPSQLELINAGVVFHRVSTYDATFGGASWVQAGWCQGDGVSRMGPLPGVLVPQVPWSFLEVQKVSADNYYHFALVGTSAQPLNAYRRYQLENTTDTHWLISIAGTARYPEYWPFQNNAPHISALAEIQRPNEGVAFPHTRSRFDNFYYKGTSSWMPMQQDNHYAEWPLEIEFSASDPTHYHLWNDN